MTVGADPDSPVTVDYLIFLLLNHVSNIFKSVFSSSVYEEADSVSDSMRGLDFSAV